jgi:hypothetical protein
VSTAVLDIPEATTALELQFEPDDDYLIESIEIFLLTAFLN